MTATHQPDALASLEDRIQQAVQLVVRLRQEKDAAFAQVERKQVRTRIEKLLEQIEQLSGG
jgi:wyosine [tRNA(Phe)-imidazoG37] synthetase (radical SAM superfamily)